MKIRKRFLMSELNNTKFSIIPKQYVQSGSNYNDFVNYLPDFAKCKYFCTLVNATCSAKDVRFLKSLTEYIKNKHISKDVWCDTSIGSKIDYEMGFVKYEYENFLYNASTNPLIEGVQLLDIAAKNLEYCEMIKYFKMIIKSFINKDIAFEKYKNGLKDSYTNINAIRSDLVKMVFVLDVLEGKLAATTIKIYFFSEELDAEFGASIYRKMQGAVLAQNEPASIALNKRLKV